MTDVSSDIVINKNSVYYKAQLVDVAVDETDQEGVGLTCYAFFHK